MSMKLTGEVILNEETLSKLKAELRREILSDINEKGITVAEAERVIRRVKNVGEFTAIIGGLIYDFINPDTPVWEMIKDNCDERNFNKLKLCHEILKL